MNKTPEEAAEEWANKRCPEQGPEFIVWTMCKEDYLAGYNQALGDEKEKRKEIAKAAWDHSGLDEESFAYLYFNDWWEKEGKDL